MKMEIDNDFSKYNLVSEIPQYAYIPSSIDVYGTQVKGR